MRTDIPAIFLRDGSEEVPDWGLPPKPNRVANIDHAPVHYKPEASVCADLRHDTTTKHLAQFETTGFPDDWNRWERAKEDAKFILERGDNRQRGAW